MRGDQQPVDLLVAVVGEREDRPVGAARRIRRPHLDTPDDAVGAGCRRHLDAIAGLPEKLDGFGQVERAAVEGHVDRFKRARVLGADAEAGSLRARRQAARRANDNRPSGTLKRFVKLLWAMTPAKQAFAGLARRASHGRGSSLTSP